MCTQLVSAGTKATVLVSDMRTHSDSHKPAPAPIRIRPHSHNQPLNALAVSILWSQCVYVCVYMCVYVCVCVVYVCVCVCVLCVNVSIISVMYFALFTDSFPNVDRCMKTPL